MAISNTAGAGGGEQLSPGERMGGGRYLLKRLLGRGGASEVWLAQDVPASRATALKFFPRAFLADANLVEHFKQQAERHLLLKHPHIATTYELVRDPSAMALAVEYVEGWSLASLKVDKLCGCYRVEEIEAWVGQLCAALEYAHSEQGIIHSDLKPANLLVNAQDELKVTDFEIAALLRKESTQRGLSKGLYSGLGFLSPQQVMGEAPSKLDDVYSLGATIFDLLTGTPPFYKGEVFAQICSLKPPSMTERMKDLEIQDDPISPVWEDTVARCLAKNPADRPQSVLEVSALLKRESLPKLEEPKAAAPTPAMAAPVEVKSPEAEKSSEASAPEAVVPEAGAPEKAPVTAEAEPATPVPPAPPAVPKLPEVQSPVVAPHGGAQWPLIVGGFALLAVVLCAAGVIAFVSLKHEVVAAMHTAGPTNSVANLVPGTPGTMDAHFNIGEGANGPVYALAVQTDGKILAVGRFTTFNGEAHKNIVRLNPDGSTDESLNFQGNGTIHAVALDGNGEIFIAGESMLKGHPRTHVIRLNSDGGIDRSFNINGKINLGIRTLAVQPDGKVIVGGDFTTLNGKPQQRLMRFETDGTPDTDFDANVFTPESVWSLTLEPDGKILVSGAFSQFDDANVGRIVRLNADGTVDNHFNTGTGADGTITSMVVQSDGAVVIAGMFSNVNGQPCPHVARLNPDGTVDTTFAIGVGADRTVSGLALQPDGKIVAVGEFNTFENVPCHYIARLNVDGSLDKSFNTGSGASNHIDCALVQPDGKILLGGSLTGFNGASCGGMARLNGVVAHP